jgi:competence protein ComGC
MIFTAICALFAFCSGDCHLEFHKDLPDQFYKLLKILMFLMVLCIGHFIFVMSLIKQRNMAMRKSWEGKAKKIISGSKPWDLY